MTAAWSSGRLTCLREQRFESHWTDKSHNMHTEFDLWPAKPPQRYRLHAARSRPRWNWKTQEMVLSVLWNKTTDRGEEKCVLIGATVWSCLLRDDVDPETQTVIDTHTSTNTYSHLFMCRMVRLPVLMLMMTTEAGRMHWACSVTRDTSMWNFWKSSKIKLQKGNNFISAVSFKIKIQTGNFYSCSALQNKTTDITEDISDILVLRREKHIRRT